jgi:hypothetical protein
MYNTGIVLLYKNIYCTTRTGTVYQIKIRINTAVDLQYSEIPSLLTDFKISNFVTFSYSASLGPWKMKDKDYNKVDAMTFFINSLKNTSFTYWILLSLG